MRRSGRFVVLNALLIVAADEMAGVEKSKPAQQR